MSIASRIVVSKREAHRRQAWDGAPWPVRAAIVRHLDWPISRTWWTYDHMNEGMRAQIARAAMELQEAVGRVSEMGVVRE